MIRLLAVALVLWVGRAGADPGVASLRLPLSVRQSGMGGVSLAGDDAVGGWLNPAELAEQRRDFAVSSGGGRLFGGDQNLFALGGGVRLGDLWTAGVLFGSTGSSLVETDSLGLASGVVIEQATRSGELLLAFRPADFVAVGVGGRYLSDRMGAWGESGVAVDLGVGLRRGAFEAGVSLRNAGPMLSAATGSTTWLELPLESRIAVGWRPVPAVFLAVEAGKAAGVDARQGVGVEWRPLEFAALRCGVELPGREWSAGCSFARGTLSLDYAFRSHVIGGSHLMALNGSFRTHRDAPRAPPAPRLVLSAFVTTDDGTGEPAAGGGGSIECRIDNRGDGPAAAVEVAIAHDPPEVQLSYDPRAVAGDVAAGASVTVRIPFTVGRDVPPGRIGLRLASAAAGTPARSARVQLRVRAPDPPSPGAALNVAVVDLEGQGMSAGEAAIATDWLRSALVSLGSVRVIERTSMQKVLAEQALQQTGCTQQDCAVKLGRVLNVRRIIVGNLGKFGGKYAMTVRVVDVENGQIVYSDQASGAGEDDLMINVRALADRISRSLK